MPSKLTSVGNTQIMTTTSGPSVDDLIAADLAPLEASKSKQDAIIDECDKKITAFSEMSVYLKDLKRAADALRNPNKYDSSAESNVFRGRQVTIYSSSETTNPVANLAKISVSNGAAKGYHSLSITNIATAKTESYINFFSTDTDVVTGTAGLFTAGTFQINGVDIIFASGDTLSQIAYKINAVNAQTSVSASIQQVSSSNFTLRIYADDVGTANSYIITDLVDGVFTQLNSGSSTTAIDANFIFDGQAITRSTNQVNDIFIDNSLQITLLKSTGADTINIHISENLIETQQAIENFIAKYNEVRMFAYRQQERSEDEDKIYKDTAVLAREPEFNAIVRDLSGALHSGVKGLAIGAKSTLYDIGIDFTNFEGDPNNSFVNPANDILSFVNDNTNKFITAIKTNIEEVRKIFEFDYVSSSANLVLGKRSNRLTATSMIFDIDTSRPLITINGDQIQDKVRIIIDSTIYRPNYNGNTNVIIGQSGSPIEGLQMFYRGSGVEKITVTMTQGIADKVYNQVALAVKDEHSITSRVDDLSSGKKQYDKDGNVLKKDISDPGIITNAVGRLQKQISHTKETIIKPLDERIERIRNRKLKEYSRLEAQTNKYEQRAMAIKNNFQAMYANR